MSAPAIIARSAPILICLNLQAAFIDPDDPRYTPRAAVALTGARSCLAWARAKNVEIMHVHTRARDAGPGAPIPGFEPRANESLIYKDTLSLFDSGELRHAEDAIADALVLGFTGAGDCLAAAVGAARAGARLVFVTDAIASPQLTGDPPEVVDAVVAALLRSWAGCVTTPELVARELGFHQSKRETNS